MIIEAEKLNLTSNGKGEYILEIITNKQVMGYINFKEISIVNKNLPVQLVAIKNDKDTNQTL